jgi:hypothetical protein
MPWKGMPLLLAICFVGCASVSKQNQHGPPDKPFYRNLSWSAANVTYRLPDMGLSLKADKVWAKDFQNRFGCFLAGCPDGYRVNRAEYDPESGYKAAIFEPAPDNGKKPWMLAFCGSDSLQDWVSDIHLARDQYRNAASLRSFFLDDGVRDRFGQPMWRRDVLVTGDSLGGGLAELNAYTIEYERQARGNRRGHVLLTSFNGFGAMEAIHKEFSTKEKPYRTLPLERVLHFNEEETGA